MLGVTDLIMARIDYAYLGFVNRRPLSNLIALHLNLHLRFMQAAAVDAE